MLKYFLDWLLNHGTLMFAAGSVANVAGGAGDGAAATADVGGNTGSAGGEGDSGVEGDAGGTSEGTGESVTGVVDGEAGEGTDPAAQDPDALVAGEDGRFIPAKYKDIFKANRELQDIYVANRFFKQEFPGGLKEARAYKTQVEKLGGESGIREISEESSYLRELDGKFLARDPKVLDTLAQADKEATVDLILHGIDKLAQLNSEQYDYTLGGIVFATVNQAQAFHDAFNVLSALKDNPQAQQAARDLREWYNGMRDISKKKPERKQADPNSEADRRLAAVEAREHEQRVDTVNSQVRPQLVSSIEKALGQEMKTAGRDAAKLKAANPKLYNRILANTMQEVKARVLSDETFKANYQAALIKEKNPQKAMKMALAKNAKVVPTAVRDIWSEFAGLVEKTKMPAPGGGDNKKQVQNSPGGAGAGFKRVASKPDRFSIDWAKSEHLVIDRKAILKDGSRVTWD